MKKRPDSKRDILKALLLITQIGLSVIVSMAISLFIGYKLDRLFNTRFIIIIFMVIGIGASIKSIWSLTQSFINNGK